VKSAYRHVGASVRESRFSGGGLECRNAAQGASVRRVSLHLKWRGVYRRVSRNGEIEIKRSLRQSLRAQVVNVSARSAKRGVKAETTINALNATAKLLEKSDRNYPK
jgi:hypothetical protein